MTASGAISEFVIGTLSEGGARFITTGPDGNLWFTEEYGNKIGRFTPLAVLTEYPLPMPGSQPFDIAPGPDGSLWFTEPGGSRIGRITTDGVISEVPVPFQPFGITEGPDGAMWFTAALGAEGYIGRVTTAGSVTTFPWHASPLRARIVTGPDGALWFPADQDIARITVDGDTSTLPIPTASSAPLDIVTGPDGNLWFTETNVSRNKLGRVNLGFGAAAGAVPTLGWPAKGLFAALVSAAALGALRHRS